MPDTLNLALAGFVTFLALHFVILIHELGHLFVGETLHFAVDHVQVGFGPRLFGFHLVGVTWEWRLIPLIGFVKFASAPEDEDEEAPEAAPAGRYYDRSPRWMRIAVALAGPAASVVLAAVCLAASITMFPREMVRQLPMKVNRVEPGSRAERHGVRAGDVLFAYSATTGRVHNIYQRRRLAEVAEVSVIRFREDSKGSIVFAGPLNPLHLEGIIYDNTFSQVVLFPDVADMLIRPAEAGGSTVNADRGGSSLAIWLDIGRRVLGGWGLGLLAVGYFSWTFAIGNMLPIYPLDGGQVLTAALEGWVPAGLLMALRLGSMAFLIGFLFSFEAKGLAQFVLSIFGQSVPR